MPTPRQNRLRSDFESVQRLATDSHGALNLISWTGSPPDHYVIEYHCRSWVGCQDGKVKTGETHRVDISLGADYPTDIRSAVVARVMTPVFNPHVWPDGAICIGKQWKFTEGLDSLVLWIGALLQLDPRVLKLTDIANRHAAEVAQANLRDLPLGTVRFKAQAQPRSRIAWG